MGHPVLFTKHADLCAVHEHDCSFCIYCGRLQKHIGTTLTEPVQEYDVYFSCEGDVIMRFGSEGHEYSALPYLNALQVRTEAYMAALALVETRITARDRSVNHLGKAPRSGLRILV